MVNYPADWEVKKAGELVRVIRGVSYKDSDVHYARQNNDCLILRGGNILGDGNINIFADDNVYINRSLISESQFLKENDIIIVASTASMKVIGKSGIIDKDYNNIAPGAFLLLIRPLQNKNVFTSYITWYFRTNLYRENIKRLVAGGVIQNIKRDYITNMQITLPPLSEQHAIANTLAVFDNHINNLSELIAKKKAIRDGALNDLMTGRTRLKGFCSAWEVKKLGECVTILQGGTPSTYNKIYWGGDIIWVTPSEITKLKSMYISDSERKITHYGLINSSATILPAGTILLCSRATIGELAISTKPMTTNQGFKNLVCKENIYNVFLAYLLQTLKKELISLARGTTFLEISKKNLATLQIPLPPLPEQQAIADTLTAFDDEILALESERDKIIQIRDGAMNDLLTGKVRLC